MSPIGNDNPRKLARIDTSLKRVSEDNLGNGGTVQVMDLTLADLGRFSLTEFALWEIEGGYGAGRGCQSSVQLKGAPELLGGRTHETDQQVGHMHRIILVIGTATRRNRQRRQELLTEGVQLCPKMGATRGGKSKDTVARGWRNQRVADPSVRVSSRCPVHAGNPSRRSIPAPACQIKLRLIRIPGIVYRQRLHRDAVQPLGEL
jgi:hypothetical protein